MEAFYGAMLMVLTGAFTLAVAAICMWIIVTMIRDIFKR